MNKYTIATLSMVYGAGWSMLAKTFSVWNGDTLTTYEFNVISCLATLVGFKVLEIFKKD